MLIPPDDSGIELAAKMIANGELVTFPTDTFYALGADGLNAKAVDDVFNVKGRNPGTPVPLLVSGAEMVEELSTDMPAPLRDLAEEFWPGALTIVLPAASRVPEVVSAKTGTVGVRVPDHSIARRLIEASGTPITGTSCNKTGRDPIKEGSMVDQIFSSEIAGTLDAPCGDSSAPSTVLSYDSSSNKINIFRVGEISVDSVRDVVGDIVNE